MGFKTDKEYLDYKESITDFLWKEVDPLVPQMEETNHITKEILFPKFREKGLFGLIIPEEYGGMGLNTVQYLPILAELSKVSGAVRALIHVHLTAARAIVFFGREEQKKELLPRIATGDLSVAFGITEANSGSGLDCKTTAVKQGDHYVLNGEKHLITNADFAKLFMIACYTRPRDMGREAMSAQWPRVEFPMRRRRPRTEARRSRVWSTRLESRGVMRTPTGPAGSLPPAARSARATIWEMRFSCSRNPAASAESRSTWPRSSAASFWRARPPRARAALSSRARSAQRPASLWAAASPTAMVLPSSKSSAYAKQVGHNSFYHTPYPLILTPLTL